jgi:hypothetical protein
VNLFNPGGGAAPAGPSVMDRLNAPPLTHFTHHLGEGIKGVVDPVLGFVQRGLSGPGGPQNFASFASLLGKPLMEPLMATPFGAPALAGLYGALRGGESAAAAHTLFAPLLKKIGLGG